MTQPQIVLVTGVTAQGLGAQIACMLAMDKSYKVYGTLRSMHKSDAFYEQLQNAGLSKDSVTLIPLDVTQPDSCQQCVETILAKEKRIDVLINNAGAGFAQTLEFGRMENVYNCFETNYFGPYRMMKLVVPGMRQQMYGRIINIASIGGIVGQPFNEAYCGAKAALDSLGESSNATLAAFNVRVGTFCPGAMASNFIAQASKTPIDIGEPYQELYAPYAARIELVFGSPQFQKYLQSTKEAATDVIDMLRVLNAKSCLGCRKITKQAQAFADLKFKDQSGHLLVSHFHNSLKPSSV